MIERPRQRHDAARADEPVGGLEAGRAAVGRRHAHRAERVRAERRRHEARRDRCARSAARSARRVTRPVRVLAAAEPRVVAGRAECGLVHVELAEDDRPSIAQPADDERVFARDVVAVMGDAAGRRHTATSMLSLTPIGTPSSAPSRAAVPPLIRRSRCPSASSRITRMNARSDAVTCLDAREAGARRVLRR